MNFSKITAVLAFAAVLAGPVSAQNRTRFGGLYNAVDYAYGVVGAPGPLIVQTGNATTGSASITVQFAYVTLGDGSTLFPLSLLAPFTIGTNANNTLETQTPTGLSNCGFDAGYGTCTVTATFTYSHGMGEPITSGSYGLQEALNAASGGGVSGSGGGLVAINGGWSRIGGTNATITAANPYSSVTIIDSRSSALAPYWTMQRTTLTAVTVPATLAAASVVFTSATGTWASSSTHFTRTFIDCMGQESGPSIDYTQTPTVNYTLTVTAPVQPSGGGACGWLMYAGTASQAVSYRLPATSTTCPGGLTTQETVIPACAMTSSGIWAATFTTTAPQSPVALGVTNSKNPVPQSAQTYGYQPSGTPGFSFPVSYGPFGSGTISSATAADVTPLGSVNLPVGFLNYIGRKIRLTGKIQGGATATGTMAILAGLTWSGTGITAGAPIPVCDTVSLSVLGTVNYTFSWSCTLVTNAVSATDAATIQPDSFFIAGGASGTTNVVAGEASLTAVTTLNVAQSDVLTIYITPATEAVTAAQLMDLNIEVLQ